MQVEIAVGLLMAMSGISVASDEPFSRPVPSIAGSAEAKARFDTLISTYRALPAYADKGSVVIVTQIGDRSIRREIRAQTTFTRPNKLVVETDLVHVLCDGTTVTEVNLPLKKYRSLPVPVPFREANLRAGALGSVEFGEMAGLPLSHILNLVIGHEPERLIADFAPRLVIEPDQMIDNVVYQVLRFDEADNHDWRFLIEPKTGLIGHVELAIEGDATRSSIAGPTVHVVSIRWSAGPITTTVPSDPARFRFQPPEGFTPVIPLDAPGPAEK